MDNKEFGKRLEERTLRFGIEIVRLSAKLPNTPEARVVRNQITKSGTSVGANYREANRARSRADFKSRIDICAGEGSETLYWLDLIKHMGWLSWEDLKNAHKECDELLAIFSSIGKKRG